jgi:hypothetical protein
MMVPLFPGWHPLQEGERDSTSTGAKLLAPQMVPKLLSHRTGARF